MKNLPDKYKKVWQKCQPYYKKARKGDKEHAEEVMKWILEYQGKIKINKDVLVPTAMMHDIGHAAILPEHFELITGGKRLANGKLVHMLAGAKIAKEVLALVGYNKKLSDEIVDIISIHDGYQIKEYKDAGLNKIYNTNNKKFFHDIDAMDGFSLERYKKFAKTFKDKGKLHGLLEDSLNAFFYVEFKKIARDRLETIKKSD